MTISSISYQKVKIDKGYTDRLLEVNLTDKTIAVKEIPQATREMFVGGRGYCLKLVYDNTTAVTGKSDSDVIIFIDDEKSTISIKEARKPTVP